MASRVCMCVSCTSTNLTHMHGACTCTSHACMAHARAHTHLRAGEGGAIEERKDLVVDQLDQRLEGGAWWLVGAVEAVRAATFVGLVGPTAQNNACLMVATLKIVEGLHPRLPDAGHTKQCEHAISCYAVYCYPSAANIDPPTFKKQPVVNASSWFNASSRACTLLIGSALPGWRVPGPI